MESPLVRRLRGALVKEAMKSGMTDKEATEGIAAALNVDVVQTVVDCITLARGRPAPVVPPAANKKPSK